MFEKTIAHLDDRGELMGRMLDARHLDFTRTSPFTLARVLREAVPACQQCRHADDCKQWLDTATEDDGAYRRFCPNSNRFDRLAG